MTRRKDKERESGCFHGHHRSIAGCPHHRCTDRGWRVCDERWCRADEPVVAGRRRALWHPGSVTSMRQHLLGLLVVLVLLYGPIAVRIAAGTEEIHAGLLTLL